MSVECGIVEGMVEHRTLDVPVPFVALAPMADVTDPAFRRLIARLGKPDLMWTEFVSADGLYHTREIQMLDPNENPLMCDLRFDESERPIIAQLFSSDPAMMEYGASTIAELGFDGVDLNMGCPDRSVEKQGAGAALLKDPKRARELIRAAKRGVAGRIPVTVKTRTGYRTHDTAHWIPELLAEEPALITLHARTRRELSDVPARWDEVREAVRLRDALGVATKIAGNGDVVSLDDAQERIRGTGADGAMIGRGVFGNPWFFSNHIPTVQEKLETLVEHCELFEALVRHKSFAVMRKHFKAYVRDFSGASQLREELMRCESASAVHDAVSAYVACR